MAKTKTSPRPNAVRTMLEDGLDRMWRDARDRLGTEDHTVTMTARGCTITLDDPKLGPIACGGEGVHFGDALDAVVAERQRRAELYIAIRDALWSCRSACLDDDADEQRVRIAVSRAVGAKLNEQRGG